jgi:nitrate reductase gamma subunit
LLKDLVPEEDKDKIGNLLQKPWNPYVRRHSSLTEKSRILKFHTFHQHAGIIIIAYCYFLSFFKVDWEFHYMIVSLIFHFSEVP